MLGDEAELHVQVVSNKAEDMIAEGKKIVEKLGKNTYVKIPTVPEGLKAMSQNEDVLTQIANNVVNDIKTVVDLDAFKSARQVKQQANTTRPHNKTIEQIEYALDSRGQKIILQKFKKKEKQTKNTAYIRNDYTINPLKLFV